MEELLRLRAVYAAYVAARRDASDPPPASLCEARLLYGAGHVCVDMPFVAGADAEAADLAAGGSAVAPVASAIAWLARHGLLYVDVRLPNVRVSRDCRDVTLVDYDDLVVLTESITSFDDFHAALLGSAHISASPAANFLGRIGAWTPLGQALCAEFV